MTGERSTPHYDVIVVGAGFGGVYMLHRAIEAGFSAHLFEAGDGPGGTWYWNRYPGARCDFESLDYSYSFDEDLQQEWDWPERYSPQPTIRAYLEHATDRFSVRDAMTFSTRIASAELDQDAGTWTVGDADGVLATATFVVMATGGLSAPRFPEIPGRETFTGRILHTASWPHEDIDFSGRRVAVVGTGSSGVQVSVEIAKQADHLLVLQRTPSYIVPADHSPIDEATRAEQRADYADRRRRARESPFGISAQGRPEPTFSVSPEELRAELDRRWPVGGAALPMAFPDLIQDEEANAYLADYIKSRIRGIVDDPRTGELLTAMTYPVASRRVVVGPGFHEMFNQPHVELVDVLGDPIQQITPTGFRTASTTYDVDDLVFATGFDALTGALDAIDIRGRVGSLQERWKDGPATLFGTQTAGFPNLFYLGGPQSPAVLANVVHALEQNVEFVTGILVESRARSATMVEPTPEAEARWIAHVAEVGAGTVFMKASSWYVGSNVPGKPRVLLPYAGGVPAFREACDKAAANGYEDFAFTMSRTPAGAGDEQ